MLVFQLVNAEEINLPKSQDLFVFSVPKGVDYSYSKPYGAIYGFPNFRLFGWSKDSRIAYSIETAIDGRGGTKINYFIQDLISDKIIWKLDEDSFKWEEEYFGSKLSIPEIAFQRNAEKINNALTQYGIIQTNSEYLNFPIEKNNQYFYCKSLITDNEKDEYGFRNIDYIITVSNNYGKEKIVTQSKKVRADAVYICGLFSSPYENRIAIIIAEEKYVFEGNEVFYSVIGCSLSSGF